MDLIYTPKQKAFRAEVRAWLACSPNRCLGASVQGSPRLGEEIPWKLCILRSQSSRLSY